MTLYKYFRPDRAVEVLQNSEVYFVSARDCNDPFEFTANADISNDTVEELKKVLVKDYHFKIWRTQTHPADTDEQWREHYYSHLDEIAAERMKALPRQAQIASNEVLHRGFDRDFVAGCFSKKSDSILMWAHYAANHTGIVIEFDMDQSPFSELSNWRRDVTYSKEKPRYKHNYNDSFVGMEEQFYTIGSTKWEEWSYEAEVRFVIPNNVRIIRDGHFLRFADKSIRSIIFGFLCEDSVRSKVEKILSFQYMSHVAKFRAIMNQEQYKLDIVPMSSESSLDP